MRARSEDIVSWVTDGVDNIFNGIGRACCEHDLVRLHGMYGIETSVEEGG